MHIPRIPFFRIFYSTTFTVLALILVILLGITPGDQIYQAYRNDQIYIIFVIAGVYLVTVIIAALIYSSRLYQTRSRLAGIPKQWIPIETADVGKTVRQMITEGFARSASIAYEIHPRDLSKETIQERGNGPTSARKRKIGKHEESNQGSRNAIPIWGEVSNPGWSSPGSPDLPNLQYEPVIVELPHLIEAKAVSLAPADPLYESDHPPAEHDKSHDLDIEKDQSIPPPLPDALAVEILQRPATMNLRDYITHLSSIDVISPPTLGTAFLSKYERARFSTYATSEQDFRALMSLFADLLRSMKELDPAILAELHANVDDDEDYDEGQERDDTEDEEGGGQEHTPTSSNPDITTAGKAEQATSIHSTNTIEHNTPFYTPLHHPGKFSPQNRYFPTTSQDDKSFISSSSFSTSNSVPMSTTSTTDAAAAPAPASSHQQKKQKNDKNKRKISQRATKRNQTNGEKKEEEQEDPEPEDIPSSASISLSSIRQHRIRSLMNDTSTVEPQRDRNTTSRSRSNRSIASGSSGSVIRLREASADVLDLPYVISGIGIETVDTRG